MAPNGIVDEQFTTLQSEGQRHHRYGRALLTPLPNGAHVVILRDFVLPTGWNRHTTDIAFVVPIGYPVAPPGTFWADGDLRLENGACPFCTDMRTEPGIPEGMQWFAWRPTAWHPNRDNLTTFAALISRRFHHVQ